MAKFVILTRLSPEGRKQLLHAPGSLPDLSRELSGVDAKVIEQYALLGTEDFLTVVDVPAPLDAFKLSVADRGAEGAVRTIAPAMDLGLFIRLIGQTTETVGPHRWQITVPARTVRSVVQWHYYGAPVRKYCQPLEIRGMENVSDLHGRPVIFIGNHTSHMDSMVMLYSIPKEYRTRLFFGGAADRWFLKGRKGIKKQGWWNSLLGTFPVHRSGGSATLDYPKWLIDKGFSIAIFPEGTRSGSGKLGKFHHGVSILALSKDVPVVPMYFAGLAAIRPKGSQELRPAPAVAMLGRPVRFEPGTAVPDATRILRHAVEALRDELHAATPAMPVTTPAPAAG
jgi:1-acyl-sn-glycerol-3-phosphate acyltransferase